VDDVSVRAKRVWAEFVEPYQKELHKRAPDPTRFLDPEYWRERGRETARRYCLHDSLSVPGAIDLDHRLVLLRYTDEEIQKFSLVAGQACLEELIRLWPPLYAMRTATPCGTVGGAWMAEIDLSGDLANLQTIGRRLATYRAAGVPVALRVERRPDGQFLRAEVHPKA